MAPDMKIDWIHFNVSAGFDLGLFKRFCHHLKQRWMWGFSDRDTWNLSHHFASMMLPRLKRFRKCTCGHPCDLTMDEWYAIIDEMIWFCEVTSSEKTDKDGGSSWFLPDSPEERRLEKAHCLLHQYWHHLWW